MLRGRMIKTSAQKKLHGSTWPINKDEPIPDHPLSEDPTAAPRHFSLEQREAWEFAIRNSPENLIKRLDSGVLEAYCVALCLHRRAVEAMGKDELTIMKKMGEAQHPLISIINKQGELVRKHGAELGFSPVSRPRILADNSRTPALGATLNSQAHAQPKDAPRQSLESYLADAPKTVN
jgi:P27 family predicted phage terminase small subunit